MISSHNLSELEDLCDQLVILDQGETKFCGTMREATQSQHEMKVKVSHTLGDTVEKIQALGIDVAYEAPELTLKPHSSDQASSEQVRAALISILESGIDIESIKQGTSLEMSLIETLRKTP